MKAIFVAWQDPKSRSWIPVGRLSRENGQFAFVYTVGAKQVHDAKRFIPFGRMTDLGAKYLSNELFPLFANRILPKSRPEYRDYPEWLGLGQEENGELEVLARSGGVRATDTLEIFPCPEPTEDNRYAAHFFSRGIRHLLPENQTRISTLEAAQRLFIMRDVQNKADPDALLLRTDDPMAEVGYCPRYFSSEFTELIGLVGADNVLARVERVNPRAPIQFRLLCQISAPWPKGFNPCSMEQFKTLAGEQTAIV